MRIVYVYVQTVLASLLRQAGRAVSVVMVWRNRSVLHLGVVIEENIWVGLDDRLVNLWIDIGKHVQADSQGIAILGSCGL